jgi:hypothetical protein
MLSGTKATIAEMASAITFDLRVISFWLFMVFFVLLTQRWAAFRATRNNLLRLTPRL